MAKSSERIIVCLFMWCGGTVQGIQYSSITGSPMPQMPTGWESPFGSSHGALGPTRSGDSWLHNLGQAQGSHSCKLFTMKESLLQIEGHRKCELIIIIWLEAAFLHWEWLDLRVKLAPRLLHHQHKNSHLYHHLLKMCKTSPKLCLLQIYMSGLPWVRF